MDDKLEQREKKLRVLRRLDVDTIQTDLLKTFAYEYAGNPAEISTVTEEFSSVCPMTGLPDFGSLEIMYVPDQLVVELKSLKYYLLQYREVGIFYEHLVNRIGEDLQGALCPRRLEVTGRFTARGGLVTTVRCSWSGES